MMHSIIIRNKISFFTSQMSLFLMICSRRFTLSRAFAVVDISNKRCFGCSKERLSGFIPNLLSSSIPQKQRRHLDSTISLLSNISVNQLNDTDDKTLLINTNTNDKSNLFSSHSNPKKKEKRNDPIILEVPTVVLKRTKQSRSFRDGNQLVFTRAIKEATNGILEQGTLVQVAVENEDKNNHQLQSLGLGVYNSESLYKVRILVHKYIQYDLYEDIMRSCSTVHAALQKILRYHIQSAFRLRQAMGLGCTGSITDTYRMINGEGDSLSGLAVDIIGGTYAVVMSSASWCEIYKDIITEVLKNELAPGTEVLWKTTPSRLQQDGYKFSVNGVDKSELSEDNEINNEEPSSKSANDDDNGSKARIRVLSKENGLLFETFPYEDGQKTGVYCDQRENRLYLSQYCSGKRVLDLCCYHGGFTITASVLGQAHSVTGVDSSSAAIAAAQVNARLNNCNPNTTVFVQSEVTNFLQKQYVNNEFYDVIVLDPPKLAPTAKMLDKARRKYHSLNRDAIKLINQDKGGFLLSCTCSAAMTEAEGGQYFLNMVQGAALAAGRQVTLLQTRGAAPCHTLSPICYPAGAYLTAALFFVHPCNETSVQ